MYTVLKEWPKVHRDPYSISAIHPSPLLSLDLEWSVRTNKPTILGLSDGKVTVSCNWEEGKPHFQQLLSQYPQSRILGHNIVSADLPVLEQEGIRIPLEHVEDTIIWHYLGNTSLCKGTKKADDDEGERRGRGFMNLFAACSTYLAVPNWKECIGEEQCLHEGRPCPKHDPWDYNGNDCYWPLLAFPHMQRRAKLLGVDRLYPLHRDLVAALAEMRDKGVFVNVEYVDKLREQFKEDSKKLAEGLPFNPNSPAQVTAYFKKKGILLDNAQQTTIDEAVEEYFDPELAALQLYGQLGNGPDRWFAPRKFNYDKNEWEGYVDESGYIHPNLQIFTSTGRLACSNPNLQNVAHRPKKWEVDADGKLINPGETIQDRIRRAIVAPEGYWLYEADYSNAENRVMLHLAGHTVPDGVDLHTWVAEIAEFKPEDPFCKKEGSPRQAAKTVQHGNFYGEGLQLLTREEFRKPRIQVEISKGIRIAYPDWTYNGMIVTFTGINFSRRAFGDASHENRIRANNIISKLFGRFPGVRELQKKISKMVESERCVRNGLGYVMATYGYPAEMLKSALAFTGSNPVAHSTKLAILNCKKHGMLDNRLQIHDSLLFVVDRRHEPKRVKEWIQESMSVTLEELGNLVIPTDVKVGSTWADLRKI